MKAWIAALALFVATAAGGGAAWAEAADCRHRVLLPADARVATPAAGIARDVARFAGAWTGTWFDRQRRPAVCAALIVEQLHGNGFAQVVYALGTHRPWRNLQPRYDRVIARIEDGVLRFTDHRGRVYSFEPDGDELRAQRDGRGRAVLARIDGIAAFDCADRRLVTPPTARDKVTASELLSPDHAPAAPVHNDYFAPLGEALPPAHRFEGRLELPPAALATAREGCPGEAMPSPAWVFEFVTVGDRLAPVERDLIAPADPGSPLRVILSPGRVWREPADGGWSRAAFPFVLNTGRSNDGRNGLATFLYKDREVSALRLQFVQETAPRGQWDGWVQVAATYVPGAPANAEAVRAGFERERAAAWPMLPLADLSDRVAPDLLDEFAGLWGREHVSATGLVVDGRLYADRCPTRYGDFPYCREMRHSVYSVTKSAGAALTLLRLAEKYGPEVFAERVADHIEIAAGRDGWADVTFAHALDMAVGVGSKMPRREAMTARRAASRDERLALIFAAPDDPWPPGERLRYDGLHTFVLAAAMESYYRDRAGPDADLWDMVRAEVLAPIGVMQAPLLRTREPDGRRGTPIFGYGLYLTVEDAAKIAMLYQNGGRYGDAQLLYAPAVRDALFRGAADGLPSGRRSQFGSSRYHHSFWSVAYGTGDCARQLPYMAGFGGNLVLLLPNGVSAIRFADGDNGELMQMIWVGAAVRPLCPDMGSSTTSAGRLSADAVGARLAGNTIRSNTWHLYLASGGIGYGQVGKAAIMGDWRVDGQGRFCTRYVHQRGGLENCYDVVPRGDVLDLQAVDRLWTVPVTVDTGNPEGY